MATKTLITKLTPEQESKIPEFIAKWVAQASKPTDREKAADAVRRMYKKMGEEPPIVIFGPSPYSTAIMAAMFFELTKADKNQLRSQLDSQLRSQLNSQLRSQLNSQLDSQLNSQLNSQLDSQLRGQLDSQLYSQLRGQLDSQLYSQLRGQLDSQLYSQLDSQLDSQLYSQLYSQLRSQLYSQLDSQLYSQLYSQLDSQLYSQLYSQLRSQLNSQLRSQLNSQLDSQLNSQLYSQLYSQLRSQLYSQLDSQLYSQLYSQLRSQLKDINQNWYLSVWWLVWSGWYDYGQYIGVEFDHEAFDLFMAFVSNVGFIIPYKGIAFVSEAPTHINWSGARRLHNQYGQAVEYSDGWGLHMLDGVKLPQELWQKITSQTLTAQEFAAIVDVDQRSVAMKYGLPPAQFIEQFEAKLINEGEPRMYRHLENYGIERIFANKDLADMTTTNRLYRIDKFSVKVAKERARDTDDTKYFLHYNDPSTGKDHISFVTQFVAELGEDADACMAKKHHMTKQEYQLLELEA